MYFQIFSRIITSGMSYLLGNLDTPIRNFGVGLNVKFEDVELDFIKGEIY